MKIFSQLQNNNWPFSVDRCRFFYGWVILFCSTIGILMSIPGQTIGVSAFTESLMQALDLSRTQLSIAYMLGTIGSSLLLTSAGRFYDRMGARITICLASFSLGLTLLFLSHVDHVAAGLYKVMGISPTVCSFVSIFFGFLLLRFSGQGVLTMSSRNMLMEWFDKKRGLVNGIKSIFVSFGFSLSPLLLSMCILKFGWRGTWTILAGCIGVIFTILTIIFNRDDPESCGLKPDGLKSDLNKSIIFQQNSFSLEEVYKLYPFWLYALSLAMFGLLMTAITFHIASIFTEAGRDSKQAFAIFFPIAIFSTTTNMISSWVSDYTRLKYFLVMMLIGYIFGTIGFIYLHFDWGYWLLIIGFGIGGGIWGVLANISWPRFYGRAHLGSISGFCGSIVVFASALGPSLFSVALDFTGNFQFAGWCCLVVLGGMLGFALIINNPHDLK